MRSDQENVEHLNLPDPELSIVVYYIDGGTSIDREDYLEQKLKTIICAKAVQNKQTDITRHYVLCNNRNQMFDPRETDGRYKIRNVWKFRSVNRSTFDLYVKFLKAKYTSLLTQAERGL